jgi:hypothetical protein
MLTPLRSFLTLIAICWASCGIAQIEKQVYTVLLKRDFGQFAKFSAPFKGYKNHTTIDSGYNRDLIPGFQETIYYIEKSFPQKSIPIKTVTGEWVNGVAFENDDSAMARNKELYKYGKTRICIVRKEDSIIYCKVECHATSSKNFHFSDTAYEFVDAAKMNMLKAEFQKKIGTPLNEKELFIDTIYYGRECSVSRNNPPAQDTIYKWVANVNMDGLKSWLQSTNTEKQVYALQGLNSLAAKGRAIPVELRKIIQVILSKNGTINHCVQCSGGLANISRLLAQSALIYIWQKP